MSIETEIRHLAQDLAPGGTVRSVCPSCCAEHEKSLAIRRDEQTPHILWVRCWRANCGFKARVKDQAGTRMLLLSHEDTPPPTTNIVPHPPITDEQLAKIGHFYNIPLNYLQKQGIRWEEDGKRLCMPWLNWYGDFLGWVEKRYDTSWHKSHHELLARDYAYRVAWPRTQNMDPDYIILVEGLLDAYKIESMAPCVGGNVRACALLGARVSRVAAAHINQKVNKGLVILLDPDQWFMGAQEVLNSFRPHGTSVRATTLGVDPKDANVQEMLDLLVRIPEMFS